MFARHPRRILCDGEKMIYDRGRIQNPISLLVNDRLQPRRVDRDTSDIGKSVASISYLPRDDWSAGESRDYNWVRIVRKIQVTPKQF